MEDVWKVSQMKSRAACSRAFWVLRLEVSVKTQVFCCFYLYFGILRSFGFVLYNPLAD